MAQFNFDSLTSASLLDELTTVASRAAAAIMAVDRSNIATRAKADKSLVSTADEASNTIILKALSDILPGIPIISEESVESHIIDHNGSVFVLLDPLDGTREYLEGRDEFTVNIAIIIEGVAAAGVISAPALGLAWRGIVGRGAERLCLAAGAAAAEATEAAVIYTRKWPPQGAIAAVSRSHFESDTAAWLARHRVADQIACGSSIKFCRIAEGSADVYARLAPTHEWDIAAGHAIVTAAGGRVTSPQGAPLAYCRSHQGLRVPAFIAFGDPDMADATACAT
jgi:3'(2'), 5'-bisphosphate nucleotidase